VGVISMHCDQEQKMVYHEWIVGYTLGGTLPSWMEDEGRKRRVGAGEELGK